MKLTYIQQSGSPPVGDGGDQYTGLDRFGRVIDQRWIKESSGADLERVEYGFDRASNRVWRDNTVADALAAKQDEFYTYDGLNQLLTLQRGTLNSGKTGISGTPTWEEDFTFDPTGNWNNYVNQENGTTTLNQPRTHNAVNEVETISGSSALIQQNAAGNMVKAPLPLDWSSAYTMTYDAWQRLVKVKSGSTTTAIYAYDGQNRRVTKVTGSTTRHYYYSSAWQILEERLNTTTTADRQFVWGLMGIDNLILRDRGSERLYSLQDVFSCTAIADIAGTVQERYGYNAFGLSMVMDADFNVVSTSAYDWETRYDCYRFDSESNFYQVRYRYLHPTLGRWLTRDPLYEPGFKLLRGQTISVWDPGLNQSKEISIKQNDDPIQEKGLCNLFEFVNNNPTTTIDILGLITPGDSDPYHPAKENQPCSCNACERHPCSANPVLLVDIGSTKGMFRIGIDGHPPGSIGIYSGCCPEQQLRWTSCIRAGHPLGGVIPECNDSLTCNFNPGYSPNGSGSWIIGLFARYLSCENRHWKAHTTMIGGINCSAIVTNYLGIFTTYEWHCGGALSP